MCESFHHWKSQTVLRTDPCHHFAGTKTDFCSHDPSHCIRPSSENPRADFWNRSCDFGTMTCQCSDTWNSGNQSFGSDTGRSCRCICLNCLSAICHGLNIESGFLPVKKSRGTATIDLLTVGNGKHTTG